MSKAATATIPAVQTDLRAVTYTKPRPADGAFGVEIVTTVTGPDGEHTDTTFHPVDPRDGLTWTKERASLLLAVLGYRTDGDWVELDHDGQATSPIYGVPILPTAN